MTDTAPSTIDWAGLPDELYEAAVQAIRMASNREQGWQDCPRRACRNAATCLGEPQAKGDAPCLAPLTPWALGHAADHWAYADWLLRRFVPAARK